MSQRILIINLTDSYITQTANLVKSLYAENAQVEISYLTKEENKNTGLISGLKHILTLDEKKIRKLSDKKIFYQAHSVNYLHNFLGKFKDTKWDRVLCISYDKLSLYVSAYISQNNTENFFIDRYKNFNTNNHWSLFRYYIQDNLEASPFNEKTLLAQELQIEHKSIDLIKSRDEYDELSAVNFNRLRKKINARGTNKKIVGIQFFSEELGEIIEEHEIISLVNQLQESNLFYPILITNKNSAELEVIDFFNSAFNKKVVTIEADKLALTSVLNNLDVFITGDPLSLDISDSADTPSLFISNKRSFKRFGSTNSSNLTIIKNSGESGLSLNIIKLVRYLSNIDKALISSDYDCYVSQLDRSKGINYRQISGQVDFHQLITDYATKEFINKYYLKQNIQPFEDNQIMESKEAQIYLTKEKYKFTQVIKNLLDTVRCLKEAKNSDKNITKFLLSYEKLLSHSEEKSVAQIACLHFKANVEQISSNNFSNNLKVLEKNLFELKNNLNTINMILNNVNNSHTRTPAVNSFLE